MPESANHASTRTSAPTTRRDDAIARAERAWPGHHGSSIGIARAPERAHEPENRALFQSFLDGTQEGR